MTIAAPRRIPPAMRASPLQWTAMAKGPGSTWSLMRSEPKAHQDHAGEDDEEADELETDESLDPIRGCGQLRGGRPVRLDPRRVHPPQRRDEHRQTPQVHSDRHDEGRQPRDAIGRADEVVDALDRPEHRPTDDPEHDDRRDHGMEDRRG